MKSLMFPLKKNNPAMSGKNLVRLICLILLLFPAALARSQDKPYVLVIHGGAGSISPAGMSPEEEQAYELSLNRVLEAGDSVLKAGGTAIDAVCLVITLMEDSPLFNAGRGAVFTAEGKNELDASLMEGLELKAGAVAGVTTVKNPILAARAVMEKSRHVMLVGAGADQFARENGLEMVDPSWFRNEKRYEQWKKSQLPDKKGTVGAVALDRYGNLAAGTSTGGMSNKKFGRVGDSPIIGAGTYANNKTCAVSSTGWGEYYIRSVAAYDVSALMEYRGMGVAEAADTVLQKIARLGGDGGMIVLDARGNFAMPFNTAGMFRGYIRSGGDKKVLMYK